MRLTAGLLAAALAIGTASAGQPRLYRWKDEKGREHVTNTPPPEGAESLDLPPRENVREQPAPPAPSAKPKAGPLAPPPISLSPDQDARWRGLEQRMVAARLKHDTAALDALAAGLVSEARWGQGLGLLLILPAALATLLVLLGWWLGHGLSRPTAMAFLAAGVVAALLGAQATLVRILYHRQATRLQQTVAALVQHLGVPERTHPERVQQLLSQAEALKDHAIFTAAPWRFSQAVEELTETLRQVVRQP